MIFVTVGTHEQPFNRLIEYIDNLKGIGILQEKVIIQTGYCTYVPTSCEYEQFYSFQDMVKFIKEARIVITHGGPSSFIMSLQVGKTPIVVPRNHKYGEHINNHQIGFCRSVAKRMGNIIVVEDISNLNNVIQTYNSIVKKMNLKMQNNNAKFNIELEKIVKTMFDE